VQYPILTQHAEVGRKSPKQSRNVVVESYPEVGGAVDMPGVYKISMARMWFVATDEVRMYGSRAGNGRNAIAVKTVYVR
jgi:hypothetical protein